ncbi:MAG: DNA polymerase III subunit delta' [Acidobacteria bacterium]|nr:DNA polymerase III subunit delta' [Acidobacteriota bacterium]
MAKKKKAKAEPLPDSPLLCLSELVGNQRPRRLLAAALIEGRLFPVLLLHGPPGIGKFTTARAIAAAVNCASPDGADACRRCPSCRKVAAWTHPDIKVLESAADAQAAGRPDFFPDAQAASRSGGRVATRLLIGQVRRLLHETAFKPFEGGRRVFIIRHLESDPSMGCANALLKVLEEPPPGTSFILSSSRPDLLPDTIRSRCQTLAFLPPSRDETAEFLTGRGIPPEEAALRAALSGGRPGAALSLDAEGGLGMRDGILAALEAAAGSDPMHAVTAAEALLPAAGEMPGLMALFALVARDIMVLPFDPQRRLITNQDRLTELETLATAIPPQRAARLLERIAWCEGALQRSVNASLMLQTLLLETSGHLPCDPLTAPWLGEEEAGT